MGFGSYDESEQEKNDFQTDEDEEHTEQKEDAEYDGDVDFELEDTESAIERLSEMSEE